MTERGDFDKSMARKRAKALRGQGMTPEEAFKAFRQATGVTDYYDHPNLKSEFVEMFKRSKAVHSGSVGSDKAALKELILAFDDGQYHEDIAPHWVACSRLETVWAGILGWCVRIKKAQRREANLDCEPQHDEVERAIGDQVAIDIGEERVKVTNAEIMENFKQQPEGLEQFFRTTANYQCELFRVIERQELEIRRLRYQFQEIRNENIRKRP